MRLVLALLTSPGLLLQQGALPVFLAADLSPPLVNLLSHERDLRGLHLLGAPLINPRNNGSLITREC